MREELSWARRDGQRVGAVIAVDLYGQCADLDALADACAEYEVPLIEDAAEALGASYKGRSAGGMGRLGVFSFNGNKIITTSGGGMLVSSDEDLVSKARWLASQARESAAHYEHREVGYNYRLSNVLAGIGRAQLTRLEDRVARRRANFDFYRKALQSEPGLTFMPEAPWGSSSRWLSVIQIDSMLFGAGPEDVRIHLEATNIESRPVWKPLHLQPLFAGSRVAGGRVAERLFERGLCLPSGSQMTNADLRRVANRVKSTPRAPRAQP